MWRNKSELPFESKGLAWHLGHVSEEKKRAREEQRDGGESERERARARDAVQGEASNGMQRVRKRTNKCAVRWA